MDGAGVGSDTRRFQNRALRNQIAKPRANFGSLVPEILGPRLDLLTSKIYLQIEHFSQFLQPECFSLFQRSFSLSWATTVLGRECREFFLGGEGGFAFTPKRHHQVREKVVILKLSSKNPTCDFPGFPDSNPTLDPYPTDSRWNPDASKQALVSLCSCLLNITLKRNHSHFQPSGFFN